MATSAPGLVGAFPGPFTPAAGAKRVLPPADTIWESGDWHTGERLTLVLPGGALVLVGQCFAGREQLHRDFRLALETGALERVTRWPGSYLAVVVRPDDVTAFVDLAGQHPLYYRTIGNRTVFGTRAGMTAAATGSTPRPDALGLAAELVFPGVPLLTDHHSAYAGLSRVAGGQALHVDARGKPTVRTYETLVPDASIPLSDAAHALRRSLLAAVQARADRALLTSDFSGGLDSTSVAFLAARQRAGSLPVFTYHQRENHESNNDLQLALRYAELDPRLVGTVVRGTPETLPYQGLDTATATDQPDAGAVVQARTTLRLRSIAGGGETVHLGGEGADALLVAAPAYLGDLARRRAMRRLYRESHAHARVREVASADVLLRSTRLSATSPRRALLALADRVERKATSDVRWLDAIAWWVPPGPETAWLTEKTRRTLAELVRDSATATSFGDNGLGAADHVALTELRACGTTQRLLHERARPLDIWPQAPFLDNDVIRACLSVPAYARARPGLLKPLLTEALSGLVPAPVLRRPTKGSYSGEDHRGARRAAGELQRRVATLRLADLGIVEPAPVQAALNRGIAGLPAPFPCLNRLLGTDLWLQTFDPAPKRG